MSEERRLADLIIRHCAPTLANLKTANLFGYRYDTADSLARVDGTLKALPLDGAAADGLRGRLEDAARKQFRRLLFAVRDEAGAAAFRQCLDAVEKLYGSP